MFFSSSKNADLSELRKAHSLTKSCLVSAGDAEHNLQVDPLDID